MGLPPSCGCSSVFQFWMANVRYQVLYIVVAQYSLTRGGIVQWGGSIYVQFIIGA